MQSFLHSTEREKPKIIIDHRESIDFDKEFLQLGAEIQRSQLLVGDFLCSDRTVVERKTRDDFESSILDGRLFTQLRNLVENYERPIIIIEGERQEEGRLGKDALLGAYATLFIDYGASVFFTRHMRATAELIFAIAKHEQLAEKRPIRIYAKRKTLTLSQNQRAIIETLPLIGPKSARNLLLHFGNVENIMTAGERELSEVEGIGSKRAKLIRKTITEKYKEEEDVF